MRLLLGEACNLLGEYVEYGLCATDPRVVNGINLAIERLLPLLNPEKTVNRYKFTVNDGQITLPRDVKTILSGILDYSDSTQDGDGWQPGCGGLVQVKSRWYEMLQGGPAHNMVTFLPATLVDMGTGFFTFDDITPDYPCFVRIYPTLLESSPPPGTVLGGPSTQVWVAGLDTDGNQVYTTQNGTYYAAELMPVPIIGQQNYVDSSVAFSLITSVSKPLTNGPLSVYAVSLDKTVQRPIAVYQAEETDIDYRRYKLLGWCGQNMPSTITVLAKRQFVWTSDMTSDLMITNVGALQNALMGIKFEKAGSFDQAAACWRTAIQILDMETRDYDGETTAVPTLQECFCAGDIWNLR
jgi:hypothetical protein